MAPFLYKLVDALYNRVMDHAPEVLQDRPMASAFVLGSVGTNLVTRGLQQLSKKVDKIIPDFDKNYLPKLEKGCMAAITAVPLIYAFVDPEGARTVMTEHPVYTSGMLGVYVGGMEAAAEDLHKRSLEERF